MPELRLGDIIDDHCSKCGLLTNHSIVSLLNGEPAKVECRTCYYAHKFRHGKGGTKKKVSRKAELFDEVLSKITAPWAPPKAEK
jgi:hypothetical protein